MTSSVVAYAVLSMAESQYGKAIYGKAMWMRVLGGKVRLWWRCLLNTQVGKYVEVFCPTASTTKKVDGKQRTVEASRLPHIFFACETEEEINSFAYDNVNIPYLRFLLFSLPKRNANCRNASRCFGWADRGTQDYLRFISWGCYHHVTWDSEITVWVDGMGYW